MKHSRYERNGGGTMIKAVFFDVGSTLIDPEPEIDGVFFEVARARGHEIEHADIACHMPAVFDFYEEEYLKDGDFWCSPEGSVEMYLEMYRYLSHLTGLGNDAEPIAQAVNGAYLTGDYWKVFADVQPCLKELMRMHLRLGIVSNWSSNLIDLMHALKLGTYFEEIISSADVGYRKPNPMIFTIILERMGLDPSEAVHVGDRPDADGVGASEAGIKPIIVDRFDRYRDCGFERIASLADLPDAVGRLREPV